MDTEKIASKTDELIMNALNFVEKSGDFIVEQAPLLVREFLMYRFAESALRLCMFFIIVVTLGVLTLIFAKKNNQAKIKYDELTDKEKDRAFGSTLDYWEGTHLHQFTFLISLACFIIMSIVFIVNIVTHGQIMMKITIAPRVYLLEELPKLIGL